MLEKILLITQIILAILLMLSILLQARGSGLSIAFGGGGGFYRSIRGAEKALFIFTILLAVLFFSTSLALLFVF